jgi:hypothetical protein
LSLLFSEEEEEESVEKIAADDARALDTARRFYATPKTNAAASTMRTSAAAASRNAPHMMPPPLSIQKTLIEVQAAVAGLCREQRELRVQVDAAAAATNSFERATLQEIQNQITNELSDLRRAGFVLAENPDADALSVQQIRIAELHDTIFDIKAEIEAHVSVKLDEHQTAVAAALHDHRMQQHADMRTMMEAMKEYQQHNMNVFLAAAGTDSPSMRTPAAIRNAAAAAAAPAAAAVPTARAQTPATTFATARQAPDTAPNANQNVPAERVEVHPAELSFALEQQQAIAGTHDVGYSDAAIAGHFAREVGRTTRERAAPAQPAAGRSAAAPAAASASHPPRAQPPPQLDDRTLLQETPRLAHVTRTDMTDTAMSVLRNHHERIHRTAARTAAAAPSHTQVRRVAAAAPNPGGDDDGSSSSDDDARPPPRDARALFPSGGGPSGNGGNTGGTGGGNGDDDPGDDGGSGGGIPGSFAALGLHGFDAGERGLGRQTLDKVEFKTKYPPANYKEDRAWHGRVMAALLRAIVTACAAKQSLLDSKQRGRNKRYKQPTPSDFLCNWVSIALTTLYSQLAENSNHPRVLKYKSDFGRLHDDAVRLESANVDDGEIFRFIRSEFTQIWSSELPAQITAALYRFQVAAGTLWEFALLALSAAVEISMDSDPDTNGERSRDGMRCQAIRQFLMEQYPNMYDILCQEQYKHFDAPGLLEVLRRYHKARHVAGPERNLNDEVVSTAAYGDPNAVAAKKRSQQAEIDRKRRQAEQRAAAAPADVMVAEDAAAYVAAPNATYQRQLDRGQNTGGCSNCGDAAHYWSWCPQPYNESRCSTARAAQRSAPRDKQHFKYSTKRIRDQGKPNPLARRAGN